MTATWDDIATMAALAHVAYENPTEMPDGWRIITKDLEPFSDLIIRDSHLRMC
jgi:hypothetical protein